MRLRLDNTGMHEYRNAVFDRAFYISAHKIIGQNIIRIRERHILTRCGGYPGIACRRRTPIWLVYHNSVEISSLAGSPKHFK